MSKQKSNWTPWTEVRNSRDELTGFYRTNGKKVQVRTTDNIRAEATCNKCDTFDLYFGFNLAKIRLENKLIKGYKDALNKELDRLSKVEHENKIKIKRLMEHLCEEKTETENS